MKKWMYVIFPGLMLAAFLVVYFPSRRATEDALARQALEVQQAKDADAAKKAAMEEEARKSAQARKVEQDAIDAKKAADKQAAWDAKSREIQADTDKANTLADASTKKANQLEIDLDTLHKQKEQENKDDFDLVKQVEFARSQQETLEEEIQRKVDMIGRRAAESTLTRMPPPALPAQ